MTIRTRDAGPVPPSPSSDARDGISIKDRCVHVPLDVVSELPDVLPAVMRRARGQLKLARALGRFAVEHSVLGALPSLGESSVRGDVEATPTPATAAASPARVAPAEPAPTRPAAVADDQADPVAVEALALPDYDSLSASQVIPRLQGLDPGELEELRVYEAAGRSRRTILNRIAQLQPPPS